MEEEARMESHNEKQPHQLHLPSSTEEEAEAREGTAWPKITQRVPGEAAEGPGLHPAQRPLLRAALS